MGQKFVPELHDPDYRKAEGQEPLSDVETERRFDAIVAKLDAEEDEEAPPTKH